MLLRQTGRNVLKNLSNIQNLEIYCGDSLSILKQLPDESINCIITSPPYFNLRVYTNSEQEIGKEPNPFDYIQNLVEIFRECRRILRNDGVFWLNIGDSYATKSGGMEQLSKRGKSCPNYGSIQYSGGYEGVPQKGKETAQKLGFKHKEIMGIPFRLAFALSDDGWILRQDIIWEKPNCLPESVSDRCTRSHEYIFLLTKNSKYYYDADAIKEPLKECSIKRAKYSMGNNAKSKLVDRNIVSNMNPNTIAETRRKILSGELKKNKRSVWNIALKPYKGAHFATFPSDLVEPMILAGCPKDGVVLDPFGGSGTTAGVALKYGRKAITMDLNEEYIKLMPERISSILNKK